MYDTHSSSCCVFLAFQLRASIYLVRMYLLYRYQADKDTDMIKSTQFGRKKEKEESSSPDVNISVKTVSSPLNTCFNRLALFSGSQIGGRRTDE